MKRLITGAVILLVAISSTAAICSPKKLIETSDYSDKDFRKCNITDYSDMVEGDDVDWVWVKQGETLSQYKLKVGGFENKSDMRSKSLVDQSKNIFKDAFADSDVKSDKTLVADICIYDAQNMNMAKAYIPFVGAHQMQAGMGIEMLLINKDNTPVAKLRHFARKGMQLEVAAQEATSDLLKYIYKH
jgi:hypothetical protein